MTTSSISTFLFAFVLILLSSYSITARLNFPTVNLTTKYKNNELSRIYAYYPFAKFLFLRETDGNQFACGFYCTDQDCTTSLLAIFIFNVLQTDFSVPPVVVWSANRDYPVSQDATLNFTEAGELVLREWDGSTIWSAGKSVATVNLTDAGNLVLLDVNNSVVWQSFDHPTDCLLSGQNLYEGQKLKSSVSLTNLSSQEGMFSLQVTDRGLFAYVESNPPQVYYSSILYGSHDHRDRRTYIRFFNGSLSIFINSSDDIFQEKSVFKSVQYIKSVQYMKLMSDGHLQVFEWVLNKWAMVIDITAIDNLDECDYPLVCGRNSICTNQQCSCPEYFRPVNDRQPNLGCSEKTPLICNSTQDHQHFITLENVKYFTLSEYMVSEDMVSDGMVGIDTETCKQACLNNCSCKAAFFQYNTNDSAGYCSLPSELFTMRSVDPDAYEGHALAFIKVQKRDNRVATVVGSTIGASMFLFIVIVGSIMFIVRRKKNNEMEEEYLDQLPGMPTRYSYEELRTATENFSKKLGQGGFGSVFEGTLEDGSKIAVKCLEGVAHVMKSFLAEIESIGSIHHVNLVRLRGFCAWRSQRLLIYDFMGNGSLDRWIYRGHTGHVLNWECRKKIVLDIARGLAYLHEECRQKIIHLDIKPQNILLDSDFNAKVSDFGLCKLIERNQTDVITSIKGTPGYIAPEWRSSIITEKMDVYSFGVVLLEILCGRKIFDRSEPEESWYLLYVFQKSWEQGTLLNMVDRDSEDMQVHKTEVVEMMKMASWCLQTDFKRRPSMSSVVKVLEGGMNVEPNLDYNFTDPRIQETTVREEKELTRLSSSLLSGPR